MALRNIVGEPWTTKGSANRLINGRISVLDARGSPPHHTVQHPGFGVYLELVPPMLFRFLVFALAMAGEAAAQAPTPYVFVRPAVPTSAEGFTFHFQVLDNCRYEHSIDRIEVNGSLIRVYWSAFLFVPANPNCFDGVQPQGSFYARLGPLPVGHYTAMAIASQYPRFTPDSVSFQVSAAPISVPVGNAVLLGVLSAVLVGGFFRIRD